MKYIIKSVGDELIITVINAKSVKDELLTSFVNCQRGECGCPTKEYRKLAELNVFSKGDNIDEIIVAFAGNYWRVYDYNGSSITSVFESSAFNEIGNLDCAKISDVDDDGTVEIIGGNYPDKVLLWEYPYTAQPYFYTSQVFTNAPWAIGVGEIDENTSNGKEILAGVIDGGLHLLHYDRNSNSFSYDGEVVSGINVGMDGIIVTDINNSAPLEIIVCTGDGLRIFDNNYNSLLSHDVGLEYIICQ